MAMSKDMGAGSARGVGGISGAGGKYVDPIYREISSKGKKQAVGFAAGAGGTAAWVGSKIKEQHDRYNDGRGNSWRKVEENRKPKTSNSKKK